ncbi:hypothetical protein D2A34_21920 [Clostridium chromiireducens]|uniref:Uncharacterized protein n=1 Tax=Clostridium chromiireducens TaxID=225345 RepID=A0A399IIL4_9CLOT|nr:hypothetical protein [Clostridium chromiireducens]RII32855.1 hypothetical protein D2A34_21920 [Clostridium chromiireducens]
MFLKGIVTSNQGEEARITFPDRDNTVSPLLVKASHVGDLNINDQVAVIFFSNNMKDGLIIAKY